MRLEDCPDEIISEVVNSLGLNDICNLRLSCKALAKKSMNPHFKTFFHSKHVDIKEDELQRLAQASQAGGLQCLVRELYLIGIAKDEDVEENEYGDPNEERNVELLSKLFDSLAQHDNTALLAISLRVIIVGSNRQRKKPADVGMYGLKHIWQATADTFTTTLRALAASKLRIQSLNIFNGSDLQRCSLASNLLNKIDWNSVSLAGSVSSLRTLSISLSNRVVKFYERGDDEDDFEEDTVSSIEQGSLGQSEFEEQLLAEANDEGNFIGLAKFLSVCEYLESFELHYLRVNNCVEIRIDPHHERLLQRVVNLDKLPKMNRCSLRGIIVRESDLLAFIKRTEPRELSLETVFLQSGKFASIFNYCTRKTTCITRIYFDVLRENERMIHFVEPGTHGIGEYSPMTKSRGVEREGTGVKQPLSYITPPEVPTGSPEMANWVRFQRSEYGTI